MGLHKKAHAGEAAGAESIWGALKSLKVDRIGHGTRAYEDNALLDYLIENQIPIEMCPVSNVKTGVVNNLKEHPVRSYFDKGLNININTDDPKMFQTSFDNEFSSLIQTHHFKLDEIKQLARNSIDSAWCSNNKKTELNNKLDEYYYNKFKTPYYYDFG